MPRLIEGPVRVAAVGEPPKTIDEYVGRVNTGDPRLSVAHMRSPAGWSEPGQRPEFDEFTLVLEGKVGARLGDEVSQLGAGATLIKPRGIPHALWNPTRSVARIVEILTPAGFERYFEELAPVLAMPGNSKAYYELSERYGVRIVDEWIPELEEKHGVKL